MKWRVTAGTGCLAHCLTDERWTVDLMIELLLNGPNCTIVCKLGKTRNTQQDPHHGTLVDWLTSVGDMSLGRNQGFNHKVTLSSIAVIQPLTLARRACDCLHQVGGGTTLTGLRVTKGKYNGDIPWCTKGPCCLLKSCDKFMSHHIHLQCRRGLPAVQQSL